ncbi:MAG TPA: GntR family transcriptional regulator, partial [bacterium]
MAIDLKNPDPLYRQIVSDIISQIRSGKLKANEQIESHQNLAKNYNVSLITVKRALADLINQRVLFSRVGKGTFVAHAPLPAPRQKRKTIGIVLRDLKSPFFSLIVHSLEEKLYKLGYNILVSTSSNRVEKEEDLIHHFRDLGVDGLMIASMAHTYRAGPAIRKLHEESFPYVMVSYVEDDDIYFVGTDHEEGAFLATVYLLDLGYETIGYINGEGGNLIGELRKKGYLR